MNFEQILVKYLYTHKKVSLEGIGSIILKDNVPDADFLSKNKNIPVENVEFLPNGNAKTDEEFIAFFAQERGKIKPLAASDIESQLSLAKQLLNIGNPYEIFGIGYLAKQGSGVLVLHPGFYISPDQYVNEAEGHKLKERVDLSAERKSALDEPMLTNFQNRKKFNPKGLIVTIIILAVLAGLTWLALPFITGKTSEEVPDSHADSSKISNQTANHETINNQKVAPNTIASSVDSNTVYQWKATIRTVDNKTEALQKQKLYSGNPTIQMETNDSTNFVFFAIINAKYSDTTHKKDSLKRFFARPITIQKMP